jgi:hypothetical protein
MERRGAKERRKKTEKADRRKQSVPVGLERRQSERRKVPRRRQIDPTTCERDYTGDELEFMNALDDYKRRSGRMFPTCSEILEVVRALGYERLSRPEAQPQAEPAADGTMSDSAAAAAVPATLLPAASPAAGH